LDNFSGQKEKLEKAVTEIGKCRGSLLYYLTNYVWIQDAVRQEITRWEAWPHLVKVIDLIQIWHNQPHPRRPLYLIIFKSRQVGITTTMAGVANWLATFFESTKGLELSKKETDAHQMLRKVKFINDQHPAFLKLTIDPDQNGMMGYPATHSILQALPSTEDAGRSTDATFVFTDEWEFHPYAENNFAAVKPTMDKGGLFVGASTVDKLDMNSFPKYIWRGAKNGDNAFIPMFFDYFVVPHRTQQTYEDDTRGLPEWQKEAEYPRNEEEALSAPQSTCFFDRNAINEMLKECKKPVEERYGGKIKIYKHSSTGRKYCLVGDPSEGQDDPCCFVVQDWQTEEDVASIHGKMSLDEQAKLAYELYQEYNEPLTSVEINAGGLTLIDKLTYLGVKNWFSWKEGHPGWRTTGSAINGGGNRIVMLNEFAEELSKRLISIPIREALAEILNFQWIDGKPQAVGGAHDDWVMAHAQLAQVRKSVKPKSVAKVSSFGYQEGGRTWM